MMDEPCLGLAPFLVAELFQTIEQINDHGLSILLVEQNVQHALGLAHQAYAMETGGITRQGAGKDLLQDPYICRAFLGM